MLNFKFITMNIKRLLTVILVLFSFGNIYAQDTLYTATGDVLIGEIKSMSKGVIIFDTDYADSEFMIEWDNVSGLISKTTLIIYTLHGERYTGNIDYDEAEKRIVTIVNSDSDGKLNLDEIVQLGTLKSSFWDRIIISIDAGLSFTKANSLKQFSTTGRVKYNADKWRLAGGFNSIATNQDSVEATSRNEANIDFSRDIFGKAFAFVGMEFLQNSEQMLDLRTTSKLGLGYYVVRTNSLFLQGVAGLANANEQYGGDEPFTENSFEGLAGFEFDAYDIGDFSFRAKITAFPSFTNSGRVRVNSDISLKWDLPLDFYIKSSVVHNFDSEPLSDVPKVDYIFQTSIGWEWN